MKRAAFIRSIPAQARRPRGLGDRRGPVATRIEPEPLSIMSAKTRFAAAIERKERRSAL
jgi:hypothetical protein